MGQLKKQEMELCRMAAAGCLLSHTRRASRALGQVYEGALAGSGVRAGQFSVLAALALGGPAAIGELGERLVVDRTTLTRNLQPLGREGMIEIAPGADRRTRMVSLTEKGTRALSRALPLWKKAHDATLRRLGREKAEAYLRHLSDVVTLSGRG